MKNELIICILAIGILFPSCEKEDHCLAEDVAGTYTGTKDCEGIPPVSITFQVTPGNSDTQIVVDGITTFIEDCDINGSSVIQGFGREIDGDIDGNSIHFIETSLVDGQEDGKCLWKAIKN